MLFTSYSSRGQVRHKPIPDTDEAVSKKGLYLNSFGNLASKIIPRFPFYVKEILTI